MARKKAKLFRADDELRIQTSKEIKFFSIGTDGTMSLFDARKRKK